MTVEIYYFTLVMHETIKFIVISDNLKDFGTLVMMWANIMKDLDQNRFAIYFYNKAVVYKIILEKMWRFN